MSNFAIIDTRMSEKCKNSLKNFGLTLIEVPENCHLDTPISAHPDIFVFSHNKYIVMEENLHQHIRKHLFDFSNIGYKIVQGENFSKKTLYPYDCRYNFAVCGKFIIGNIRYIEPKISKYANEVNMTSINVKQGYAKCNICVVGENAIITEDCGIARECRNYGIDVLLLKNKAVKLNGYDNGFIGGASGVLDNSKILFCGNVEKHPEYSDIKTFCQKHGAELISLSDEDLYDCGSIIVL